MALWRGSIDLKFPMKDDFKVHMMLNRKSILESYLQALAMWISMLDAMKPVDADAVAELPSLRAQVEVFAAWAERELNKLDGLLDGG
jgi:hypothetical protein